MYGSKIEAFNANNDLVVKGNRAQLEWIAELVPLLEKEYKMETDKVIVLKA